MTTTTERVPARLKTPTDLDPTAVDALSEAINALVADAFALYLKTKNYHWHMSGSHYRDYHLLLDEQADQIFAMTDILAERVRKIGGLTIRSIGHVGRLQSVVDDDRSDASPYEMLAALVEDNKAFAARQRRAHAVCDEHGDVATASLLENFIDETERRTWFLFETLQGAEHTN